MYISNYNKDSYNRLYMYIYTYIYIYAIYIYIYYISCDNFAREINDALHEYYCDELKWKS